MEIITSYKGCTIFHEYGFYSPEIDITVCERDITKVMEWIDSILVFNSPEKKYKIDPIILGTFEVSKSFMIN